MEKLAKKYKGKVEFLFIYCREAHPESDAGTSKASEEKRPLLRALSYEERKAVAKWFHQEMRMERRLLLDEFDERSVYRRYRQRFDNPTLVVDLDGINALWLPMPMIPKLDHFLERFLAGGAKWDPALLSAASQ